MKKEVKFKPFDRESGLELFDADSRCSAVNDKPLEELSLEELEVLKTTLTDSILDWETIIGIELDAARQNNRVDEYLANDRRRRQQLVNELRMVKKRIKMMKNNNKELSVI